MKYDEQIIAHLMWVWKEKEGFLKRGREGMLVITNFRIAFIIKTKMAYRHHDAHSLMQLKRFQEGNYKFHPIVGYNIRELETDLNESTENLSFPFEQVLDIRQEVKRWGTRLRLLADIDGVGTSKTYTFCVVKGWVKYPLKDPTQFQHVNWTPIIRMVEGYKKNPL